MEMWRVFLLIWFSVAFCSSVVVGSERCKSANEPPLHRLVSNPQPDLSQGGGYCCDTWQLLGSQSGCHYHPFSKAEVLENCISQQVPSSNRKATHIISFGGSTHYGAAMALLKLMDPAPSYPIQDPTSWYNCLEPCDLLNRGSRTINFLDIVVAKSDGRVLSKFSLQDEDMVSKTDGKLRQDHADRVGPLLAEASSRIPDNEDYLRVTYAKVRYFSAIYPVTRFILSHAPSTDIGLSPFLIVGIRSQWYQYCWRGFSYCPRDDLKGVAEDDVKDIARKSAASMVSDIVLHLPPNTRLMMVEDEWNPWVNDAITNAFNQFPVFRDIQKLVILAMRGSQHQGGSSNSLLRHDGHPLNKRNAFVTMQYFNVLCPSAGEIGERATNAFITFNSNGCSALLTPDAAWMDHYLAPCSYVTDLELSPTTSPTRFPTTSPTNVGATPNPTGSPTSSAPTISPTGVPEIELEFLLPSSWRVPRNLTSFFDPFTRNTNGFVFDPPAPERVFVLPPYVDFHYITSGLCGTFLAIWFVYRSPLRFVHSTSETSETNVSERQRNGFTSSLDNPTQHTNDKQQPVLGADSKRKPRTGHMSSLGVARFIASVHIVVGHLSAKHGNYVDSMPTNGYGFTWVPWFLMLSGFILTHASVQRLTRKPSAGSEKWHQFVYKRVRSIYPLYIVGLFTAAGIASLRDDSAFSLSRHLDKSSSWQWGESLSVLFLFQAWVPQFSESVFQAHCWFLSCITIYWALHNTIFNKLNKLSTRALAWIVVLISILPWMFLAILPTLLGFPMTWHQERTENGEVVTGTDVLVVMLKFHPVFYWHIYLHGMVLALLFNRKDNLKPTTHNAISTPISIALDVCVRWGCVLGYLSLFGIFSLLPGRYYNSTKLILRLGGLTPLHSLVLLGCASGCDPLAMVLGHPVLQPLGDISYAQYIFQFVALSIWDAWPGFGYWSLLLTISVVGFHVVQEPLKSTRNSRQKQLAGIVCSIVLFGLLLAMFQWRSNDSFATLGNWSKWISNEDQSLTDPWYRLKLDDYYARNQNNNKMPNPPKIVQYSARAIDVEIQIGSWIEEENRNLFHTLSDAMGQEYHTINPSVVVMDDGNVNIALRRHMYSVVDESGDFLVPSTANNQEATIRASRRVTTTWHSDVVVGTLRNIETGTVHDVHVVDDSSSEPVCSSLPVYNEVNDTLSQVVTVGLEDPRLVVVSEPRVVHDIFTTLNVSTILNATALAMTTFTAGGLRVNKHGTCDASSTKRSNSLLFSTFKSLHHGSFSSKVTLSNSVTPSVASIEMHPKYAQENKVEKNWMSLWLETTKQLLFVQHLQPLVILEHDMSSGKWDEVVVRSDSRLADLVSLGYKVHGGSNFVRIPESVAVSDNMYLGMFHTVSSEGVYMNHLVELLTVPEFKLGRISRPLPLLLAPVVDASLSNRIAFGSGLAFLPDERVMLTYGSSNSQARMLLLTWQELELFFEYDNEPDEDSLIPTATPSTEPPSTVMELTESPTTTEGRSFEPTASPSEMTEDTTEIPTLSPQAPTISPEVRETGTPTASPSSKELAESGDRCSEPPAQESDRFPQCVATTVCVAISNWSKCIDCSPSAYQRDCKYWQNEEFIQRAATLCAQQCNE